MRSIPHTARLLRQTIGVAIATATLAVPAVSLPHNVIAHGDGEIKARFPDLIAVPNGFGPEGIAIGRGTTFFVGNMFGGAIYRGDLRTGRGTVLVASGTPGTMAIGLNVDRRTNQLFVAGGFDGTMRVYAGHSGALLATYQLAAPSQGPLINDIALTERAAYTTDSCGDNLYEVPLGRGGRLQHPSRVRAIHLTGDFQFQHVPFPDPSAPFPCFPNANGIVATENDQWLILADSLTQSIFRVHSHTGQTVRIDVGGSSNPLPNADGLVLDGSTLYVVQNFLNRIAVIELAPDLKSGVITEYLTAPGLDVPTTAALFGSSLYAINARFGVPPTPETEYHVVKVPR
jgi:sugar lactone lactonase YvrE